MKKVAYWLKNDEWNNVNREPILFLFVMLIQLLCVGVHMHVWRSKGVSQKPVLSFYHAGLRYCTQFIRLDNRHVYLLSHVVGSKFCSVLVISNFCFCLWVILHVFLTCHLLGKLGYCDFCSQPESIVCGSEGSNQAAAWKRLQWVDGIPDCPAGVQNGTGFLPFWMMVLGGMSVHIPKMMWSLS